MGLLVHNGSEAATYNSYATLLAANAYHADRATPGWAEATTAQREAALIRATDYVDQAYKFTGDLNLPTRAKAVIVMAVYALASTLVEQTERGIVETEQELSGVGKERIRYDTKAVVDPYPAVTRILAPITVQTSESVQFGRAVR